MAVYISKVGGKRGRISARRCDRKNNIQPLEGINTHVYFFI
jgi:hypothetical protein